MLHVGVFILLLLSGERNFGVRLNKPYVHKVALPDIPKFSGTHADLLFLVCVDIISTTCHVMSCDLPGVPQDHHQWTATPPASIRLPPNCSGQW